MLFGIGPLYMFILQHRIPLGLMRAGSLYWKSAMGTNLALLTVLGAVVWFGGWVALFAVVLPSVAVGAITGVWLFYVQHQFEDAFWDVKPEWQVHHAALHGSSYYVLPQPLAWLSGYIGIHHVHHLYARIPFYRLPEVLLDHPMLAEIQRLTIRESLSCVRLTLWDEDKRQMVGFSDAR